MRNKPAALFGLLLCYFYFRGIGDHGLIDTVEGINASIAAHMAGGGNYFVPKIGGALASGSTMGSWWLSVIALKLFGWGEFAVRFFPALSGLVMVWASARAARSYSDDNIRKSWLASCVCAGMTLCFAVSQVASSHAVYSCLMGLAMTGIILSRENKRRLVMAHSAITFAFIAHGFEGIILPFVAVIAYCVISEDWELLRDFFTWPGGIIITVAVSGLYFIVLMITNPEIIHFMRCQNHSYTFGGIPGVSAFLLAGFVPFHGFILRALYEVFPEDYPAGKSPELFMLVWAAVFGFSALLSGDILAMGACVPALSALLGRKLDSWLGQRSFSSIRYAVMINTLILIPLLYVIFPLAARKFPVLQASMMSLVPWGLSEGLFLFASWYYTKTRQPRKWARNVPAAALLCLMPLAGVFNLTAESCSMRSAGMKLRDIIKGGDTVIQYGVNYPSVYFYTLRNSRIIEADLTPGIQERQFTASREAINQLWAGKSRVFMITPDTMPSENLPNNIFPIAEGEGLLLLSNQ
ncbi:MAG: glycosyltransferase family 39 protein [Synergistaceae bacterium]|nr:glycosyltransferase family 39 protein [Synergistaceae bacterium]